MLLAFCLIAFKGLSQLPSCDPRPYTQQWDWRGDIDYTLWVQDANRQPITMNSKTPWYATNQGNLNILSLINQSPKDYEPTDGWVLVQRDFGTQAAPIENPYFVLYNKLSGILRVFVCITKTYQGYDKATIRLWYVRSSGLVRSAVLENHTANPSRSALDDFDNQVPEIVVSNSYANIVPYWLTADFNMNYDPCTCRNNSQLFMSADLVTDANLSFQINSTPVTSLDNTGKAPDSRQNLAKTGLDINVVKLS